MRLDVEFISADIAGYLQAHQTKSLLRFITCGSVDDGKSTLIGRLLYDSKAVFSDQIDSLRADSRRSGTRGADVDFALLVDGLAAEREQGITIDVAYRYFSTEKRKFIVADTPGHEQYTRNMVTGASNADAAIILVDATKGILNQTRRHTFLTSLLGIRHTVLAINKMDLVGWSEEIYNHIVDDYRRFLSKIGDRPFSPIPLSAVNGDNLMTPSAASPWYNGPCLINLLENLSVGDELSNRPFRLPVQWVNRPNSNFRGYSGLIASGVVRVGDRISALPGGHKASVTKIVSPIGEVSEAIAGESVTIILSDEIDISRGDVLAPEGAPAEVADQFEATIVWMDDDAMLPGRSYQIKMGTKTTAASITEIKYLVNVDTLEQKPAKKLSLNDIAVCNISLDQKVVLEPYKQNKDLGGFILIDRISNRTVAAGLVHYALRRSHNIQWQDISVTGIDRAALKHQKGVVFWFTGISGAGKSTVANLLERKLHSSGRHTYILDGDNVRHGLNRDLGFSEEDRVENIRRVAEVAKLMVDAGLIVLVSLISPFRAERDMARSLMEEGQFVEIHVDTPISLAADRDVKGLYKKAYAGELTNFTGVDSPYEAPDSPEFVIDTTLTSADEASDMILAWLDGIQ